jgi:hypothetical protein
MKLYTTWRKQVEFTHPNVYFYCFEIRGNNRFLRSHLRSHQWAMPWLTIGNHTYDERYLFIEALWGADVGKDLAG